MLLSQKFNNKMIVKKHKIKDGRLMLAVCDSSLKGKLFEEKGVCLDLSSNFYNGKEINGVEILKLFRVASIVNLVGKKSVRLGIEAGIIDKNKVIKVENIVHAQGIIIREDY